MRSFLFSFKNANESCKSYNSHITSQYHKPAHDGTPSACLTGQRLFRLNFIQIWFSVRRCYRCYLTVICHQRDHVRRSPIERPALLYKRMVQPPSFVTNSRSHILGGSRAFTVHPLCTPPVRRWSLDICQGMKRSDLDTCGTTFPPLSATGYRRMAMSRKFLRRLL